MPPAPSVFFSSFSVQSCGPATSVVLIITPSFFIAGYFVDASIQAPWQIATDRELLHAEITWQSSIYYIEGPLHDHAPGNSRSNLDPLNPSVSEVVQTEHESAHFNGKLEIL